MKGCVNYPFAQDELIYYDLLSWGTIKYDSPLSINECREMWKAIKIRKKTEEVERDLKLTESFLTGNAIVWSKDGGGNIWDRYQKGKQRELERFKKQL